MCRAPHITASDLQGLITGLPTEDGTDACARLHTTSSYSQHGDNTALMTSEFPNRNLTVITRAVNASKTLTNMDGVVPTTFPMTSESVSRGQVGARVLVLGFHYLIGSFRGLASYDAEYFAID